MANQPAPITEQLRQSDLLPSSSKSGAMAAFSQNLVGPQIRRLRTDARLSQEALAAKLQVAGWDLSRGGLSKIEAGLRRVNDAELWVLAQTLGCPITDLFPVRPKRLASVLRQGRGLG